MRRIASYTKYLFAAEATIHDVVEHQRQSLKQKLDEIGSETVLARPIQELTAELVETFRLEVPGLNRSEITQLPNEEVDIDVSQDPMRGIFDPSQPFYVKGTMIRIAIPFSGDSELFKYGSSPFNSPIPGEIEANDIVLAYTAENPDLAAVQRDFDNRLSQIEVVLNMITGPAEQWNHQLRELIGTRLEQRRTKVQQDQKLSLGYPLAASTSTANSSQLLTRKSEAVQSFDLFLSHAGEDKNAIARPLYAALAAEGVSVWFDEAVLRMGDSLRRKIDEGLARCRYGVVILSPRFLSKQWPQRELDGFVARETASGEKAILPIWHELDRDTLLRYSPPLADRLAGRSEDGIASLVKMILEVLR
jgi:hypothetical protein